MAKSAAIILAAGKGTRMNIDYPKVLADLHGKPLVRWVLDNVQGARPDQIVVVVGFQAELVKDAIDSAGYAADFEMQEEQLGTGHAARIGLKAVGDDVSTVVVTYGDMPFISSSTLTSLIEKQQQSGAAVVITSVSFDDPMGPAFGRVKRDENGKIMSIVEQKMCSPEELKIKECNAGPVAYDPEWLQANLDKIQKNSSGEYYLTDLVELAYAQGKLVESVTVTDAKEMHGVNTQDHLKAAQVLAKN